MNQIAVLAAGCFWGVQYYFDQVPGVIETQVGYTGGRLRRPTYEQVCSRTTGHAEAVRINYQPGAVLAASAPGPKVNAGTGDEAAFGVLLKHFFRMHDPTQLNRQGVDVGDQYRSAIFYTDVRQKKIAQKIIGELNAAEFAGRVVTAVEPLKEWWPAEEYHQKFTEKTGRGMCHVAYQPV